MDNKNFKKKFVELSRISYAAEKFDVAVYILATDNQELRGRLQLATKEFIGLSPEHIPIEIKREYDLLKRALTVSASKNQMGHLFSTIGKMREDKLTKVAISIVRLSDKLQYLRYNEK